MAELKYYLAAVATVKMRHCEEGGTTTEAIYI